jgi:hypothetical protein
MAQTDTGQQDWIELRVSNEARDDTEELRRRLDQDGYLFFKQLQNPDRLRALRREMLMVMQGGGWLVAGTDPADGIANLDARCTEGDVEYTDVYHEVYKLESFHRAAHQPDVLGMVEQIYGKPAMPHPQKIARLWFPHYTEHTTPAHQDFVHFQGNFQTLTCWAPVGDCPRELGGLAMLAGSHKTDQVLEHHFSLGAGALDVELGEEERVRAWHSTDYEIGDTLIFPALTIHKALPNVTENRLRVSLDNRYQAIGDPIAEHMLLPHLNLFNQLGWEDVYRDWESDDLKYYWKKLENPVVPRDLSYLDKGFDEAVDLAKAGDPHARHFLARFLKRDPESPQARIAETVLEEAGD